MNGELILTAAAAGAGFALGRGLIEHAEVVLRQRRARRFNEQEVEKAKAGQAAIIETARRAHEELGPKEEPADYSPGAYR